MFVSGLSFGAFFGMGAVYASDIGLSVKDISLYMGSLISGGFLFQYHIGWLSDTFGPIKVILFSSIAGHSFHMEQCLMTLRDWNCMSLPQP